MRLRDTIQGYVITELTDANWEANGLMRRGAAPKVFAGELGKLQQDDLVMAGFAAYNFISGSPVAVPLTVSHYSTVSLEGAAIQWQTSDGQSGSDAAKHVAAAGWGRCRKERWSLKPHLWRAARQSFFDCKW